MCELLLLQSDEVRIGSAKAARVQLSQQDTEALPNQAELQFYCAGPASNFGLVLRIPSPSHPTSHPHWLPAENGEHIGTGGQGIRKDLARLHIFCLADGIY